MQLAVASHVRALTGLRRRANRRYIQVEHVHSSFVAVVERVDGDSSKRHLQVALMPPASVVSKRSVLHRAGTNRRQQPYTREYTMPSPIQTREKMKKR